MGLTFGGAEARDMHRILINGAWVDALTESGREIRSPATLEPLGMVPDCGSADITRAVAAAKAAQRAWWKVPGVEKARLLREIGTRIRAREHSLASLMTQETG
jgi:acyl-CoA reductase-like NAD-dependent aldehyde dehydrogenase